MASDTGISRQVWQSLTSCELLQSRNVASTIGRTKARVLLFSRQEHGVYPTCQRCGPDSSHVANHPRAFDGRLWHTNGSPEFGTDSAWGHSRMANEACESGRRIRLRAGLAGMQSGTCDQEMAKCDSRWPRLTPPASTVGICSHLVLGRTRKMIPFFTPGRTQKGVEKRN